MKKPKKTAKKPGSSRGDPRVPKSTRASLKKQAKKHGLKVKLIRQGPSDSFAEADLMGRIMAHQFGLEMEKIRDEEIEGIPAYFRELIAEAATRWVVLIRTGPTLEFNKAQRDLVLVCDLYEWYLSWQAQSQASSTEK